MQSPAAATNHQCFSLHTLYPTPVGAHNISRSRGPFDRRAKIIFPHVSISWAIYRLASRSNTNRSISVSDYQFPIDVTGVAKDHPFLEADSLQSLFRRLHALNRCANMKLDTHHHHHHTHHTTSHGKSVSTLFFLPSLLFILVIFHLMFRSPTPPCIHSHSLKKESSTISRPPCN